MAKRVPHTLEQWAVWFQRADGRQHLKERALDAISNGVVITDPGLTDNPIIYCNEAFQRLTGYAPEEILGRNCRFLQAGDRDQPDVPRIASALAAGREVHAVLRNYRKDGTMFWNELFIAPVRDEHGRVTQFVGVQQDITERKELERLVGEQLEQLRALDQMKRLFIGAVSHELRTPLTTIKGFSEFLDEGIGGKLSSEQAGFVDQIRVSLTRLERLVDDLLDAARLEGGTFRLSKQMLDFCGKLIDVANEFRPQALQTDMSIMIDCPYHALMVYADSQRLTQVLTNLLGNALKFSPAGSEVRVHVDVTDDGLVCRIIDHGVGIAPTDVTKLFKPFAQLSSGARHSGGTGLGLSISKSIIEAHHGRIGVESRPDGTTFWFYLPRPAAQDAPAP